MKYPKYDYVAESQLMHFEFTSKCTLSREGIPILGFMLPVVPKCAHGYIEWG